MIEAPLCTDFHLQVTKGVGIEQIYPSVGASIKASGLWILNLLRTSYSRDLLMFILASFVSSSVGEIVMQGCDLQLMRWIHTTSFLVFPHQECVHMYKLYIYIYMCFSHRIPLQNMYTSILQLSLYNPLLYKSCFSEASISGLNHFMLPGTWTTIRVETPNAPWSSLQLCRREGPGGLKHSEAKSLNDPMAQNPTPQ